MNAQTEAPNMPKPRKNSIYLEGLGNGILYSINYDHLFSMKNHPKVGVGTRIGVSHGTYPWIFGTTFTVTTLPAEIYFSYGRIWCLELGLGYTSVFEEHYEEGLVTFRSGCRYRSPNGFMLGAGILATMNSYGISFPYPQLSVGFTF
jgi:hypothetical protein